MKLTYRELITFPTIEERYKYLRLGGIVGEQTFGAYRYLNQDLYRSSYWRNTVRPAVIIRDNGMDMACDGYPIGNKIIIHHLNPITIEDIDQRDDSIFDMDNLVCVSENTHKAIHYGYDNLLPSTHIERYLNDTCPWKTIKR